MAEHPVGLLDTSVVIDLPRLRRDELPSVMGISSVTLAELAAGPHATEDRAERARRQDRLQRVEATFDAIPFDGRAARSYGLVYAAVASLGRKPRGPRVVDLMIASVAVAHAVPLFTRNPDDLRGLEDLLEVVPVA